jgi:hypothetical protein
MRALAAGAVCCVLLVLLLVALSTGSSTPSEALLAFKASVAAGQ